MPYDNIGEMSGPTRSVWYKRGSYPGPRAPKEFGWPQTNSRILLKENVLILIYHLSKLNYTEFIIT